MIQYFEGIRIITFNTRRFNRGSAITIPGVGIFLGLKQINNLDLLRHEYGHILQRQQIGFLYFWLRIAPVSLWSSFKTLKNKNHIHMHTWTEWSANRLSFDYFKRPANWNFKDFPVQSPQ